MIRAASSEAGQFRFGERRQTAAFERSPRDAAGSLAGPSRIEADERFAHHQTRDSGTPSRGTSLARNSGVRTVPQASCRGGCGPVPCGRHRVAGGDDCARDHVTRLADSAGRAVSTIKRKRAAGFVSVPAVAPQSRSICERNCRKSVARWCWVMRPSTSPVAILKAACRFVVPCRL